MSAFSFQKTQTQAGGRFAVVTQDLCFQHRTSSALTVDRVSLRIPSGIIYGLLGPSGCGKTSLLKCLLRQATPQSGKVLLFGCEPGSPGSLIPGPGVGYMPQDSGLMSVFTIRETIAFFGRMNGMSGQSLRKRIDFLVHLLDLPSDDPLVQHLSGGQQRRVSLAAALIHSPPLLVLDEPTVGVDPILREAIWRHLERLTREENMTILLTTHYVEEARGANIVSFMRSGRLLIQDSPDNIISRFGSSDSLEHAFLSICSSEDDNGNNQEKPKYYGMEVPEKEVDKVRDCHLLIPRKPSFARQVTIVKILARKSLIKLRRSIPELLFNLINPAIQVILFCAAIGRPPVDLPVALFNGDTFNLPAGGTNYSSLFLNQLDSRAISLTFHPTLESAIASVQNSHSWSAIEIPVNYSYFMGERIRNFLDPVEEEVDGSTIRLHSDMTEFPIQVELRKQFAQSMMRFAEVVMSRTTILPGSHDLNLSQMLVPLVHPVDPPIFGHSDPDFREFSTPAFMLGIVYVVAVGLATLTLVQDRKEGILERCLVAGVRPVHILLTHCLIQMVIIVLQSVFLLGLMFFLFTTTPFTLSTAVTASALVIMQAATGMSMGFMVSSLCHEERSATLLSLALFYPNLILSGMMWPMEGMPFLLRSISYFLPQTMAIHAMRSIVARGLSLAHVQVYMGFISSGIWIFVLNSLALLFFSNEFNL